MIEDITKKLQLDKYEITFEDFEIIDSLNSLKKLLIKGICENRISIKIIIDEFVYEDYIEFVPEDKKKDFVLNYLYDYLLLYGIIDEKCHDNIYNIMEDMYQVTEEETKNILNKINEDIKDSKKLPADLFPIKDFEDLNVDHYYLKLLEYKRYDILEIKKPLKRELEEETYKKIVEEYPFDQYKVPQLLYPYLIRNKMYLFNINDFLLYDINNLYFDTFLELLKDKSKEEIENIDIQLLYNRFNKIKDNQKEIIAQILIPRNILIYIDPIEDETLRQQYIKLIEDRIKSNIEIDPQIIKSYYSKIEDQECLDIINNSKYKLYLNSMDNLPENLNDINLEKEINISYIDLYVLGLLSDEMFDQLINYPNITGSLELENYENSLSKDRLKKLLSSNIEIRKIDYSKILYERDVLEIIIEKNLYDKIFETFNSQIEKDKKTLLSYPDLAIKYMENNPLEVKNFILNHYPDIMECEEVMNYIYNDDYYITLMLNDIEHANDRYSEEIFQNIKEYLAREYEIDEKKLELIESKTGPSIIKFINNENIQKLLNLNEENLKKVIELFPDVTYTLSDINSAYDSIIQYYYPKKRTNEYEIFHNICEAIRQDDKNELNILKCNILGLVTEEEFLLIAKQNNITQTSLNDYLDTLFTEIANGNNIQENLNNLHIITDQYLLKSRQEFRLNHLYIDNPEYIDFQKVLNKIDFNDNELEEILKQYMEERYTDSIENILIQIKDSIKNNRNPEKEVRLLKKIIDSKNEKLKRENPIVTERHLKLPFRLEKKTMSRFIDKSILGKASSYEIDGKNLLDVITENMEKQGISRYAVIQALNYYSSEEYVPKLDDLKIALSAKIKPNSRLINKKTNKEISVFNRRTFADYFINNPEELDNYYIEESKIIYSPQYQIIKTTTKLKDYMIYKDIKFQDVLDAIKEGQTDKTYIKSIIGRIISEYKKIEKTGNIKSIHGFTPKEETFNNMLTNHSSEIFVIEKGKPYPLEEVISKKLKEINSSKEDKKEAFEIMGDLYEKDLLYFIEPDKTNDILFNNIRKDIAKRKYTTVLPDDRIIEIINEIDIDLLEKTVLTDDELYNYLKELMKKKKLHIIPDEIVQEMQKLDLPITMTPSNVAGLISYYKTIAEDNPNLNNSSFIKIAIQGELYSGVSQVYKQILGPKDANLIKENPGPNQASKKLKNNERLNESVTQTVKNYQRNKITIPPFDEVIEVNKKKINIIVGNFTDTSNLTHGERTGACMRIGGVGESLYDFVMNNENGFHIRFEDPDTKEYISRVSGFRNGNTVFLNELRNSCTSKYRNKELVEACKIAANKLIEKSKDSTCPIENVVITSDYAMGGEYKSKISFGIDNSKEGLPYFYSDINTEGIVLATTSEDGNIQKINFDKSQVPTYAPQRGKIVKSDDEFLMESKIARVATVKKIIEGTSFKEIGMMSFESGFKYGIVSDDWYVYIDDDGNIFYDIIDIDPRAKIELQSAIEEMQSKIDIYERKEIDENGKQNKNR